ncbi:MAG: Eco57I restriction-modification methylase domain-containing protein [Deltaproteobacteria bacterium]|jgi:hypothetical protein|nr:Eco57I restriction-modification methylase domain-containing protein [Deltaproteobacteria bacterium]
MAYLPLFSYDYLRFVWNDDFNAYNESEADSIATERLRRWAHRDKTLTETQLEAQFIDLFFKQTWNFWGTGEKAISEGYCLSAQYGVDGAGQSGGRGAADLALGWWGRDGIPSVPQVLAEFKDIRTSLDLPQKRKGSDRSPVKQCFDYLKYAFDATSSGSILTPTWGLVTDMNEFRLYHRVTGEVACQRFVIASSDANELSLLDDGTEALFLRFVFQNIFSQTMLLSQHGKSSLSKLLDGQIIREREFENNFYAEYHSYRKFVFRELLAANPAFAQMTRSKLVKLTQLFLDRCLFILFCEDMGRTLEFPNNLLRDILIGESLNPYYSPQFVNIWTLVKHLFSAMRDGGLFPPNHKINRFNGGLFEELPELDNLVIPNIIFCTKGQGTSQDTITASKDTLLYLSAKYNFGAHGAARERTVTLYTLGRIFEQSITDLEYMAAEADSKQSIASLTKRRRDGVYYTPEWVTDYIVRETVGERLSEIRKKLDLEFGFQLPIKPLIKFRQNAIDKLNAYEYALDNLKILDPSCGSGAFLIQALQFLIQERRAIAEEKERISGGERFLFDMETVTRSILSNNLYGVDINPESVELTQLALWLHTALPGKPLSNLSDHICCGNSLVGPEFEIFYNSKHQDTLFDSIDEQMREDINVFDWTGAFPEVFGDNVSIDKRGFDCVIGNPPYVKLQHFRKLKNDESDFYIRGRNDAASAIYASAQTGNFDLYLLFIEKGFSLLNSHGIMGFIAPSLWLKNEYGLGLRQAIKKMHALDRFIDFKSYQVFEEAATYTALQFFSKRPKNAVRFALAPGGESEVAAINWNGRVEELPYDELPLNGAWHFISNKKRHLFNRLRAKCESLEQASADITVGLQTSCDLIYHLHRLESGRYRQIGPKGDGLEHQIEDAIMHPLVSGAEAKRYLYPKTDTYLLFPYGVDYSGARLYTEAEMMAKFPNAWVYLKKFENLLRVRESNAFNDGQWYRLGRNQNLDKQEIPKLGVAQTVPGMRVFADEQGEFYFNNVRVNGILPADPKDLFFLLGVLNSPVSDFIFKLIAAPKNNGYFEANKQYIAPLPMPPADDAKRAEVGKQAEKLQKLHTELRDKMDSLKMRLYASQCVADNREPNCLWADLKLAEEWLNEAPEELSDKEKRGWAKKQYEAAIAAKYDAVDSRLGAKQKLSVKNDDGELTFFVGESPVVTIYADQNEVAFIAAQWRQIAREIKITGRLKAQSLIKSLLSLRKTSNKALCSQIIDCDGQIQRLMKETLHAESSMNDIIYKLYKLSEDEIKLIETSSRHSMQDWDLPI